MLQFHGLSTSTLLKAAATRIAYLDPSDRIFLSTSLWESSAVNVSEGIEVGKQITVLAAKTQDEDETKGEDVEDVCFETVAEAKK